MCTRILIILVCFTACISAKGQRAAVDTVAWQPLKAALALNDLQWTFIDSLYRSSEVSLKNCDREINRIARTESDSTQRVEAIQNIKTKKQTIREERDAAIEWVLTQEQRAAFRQYTQPGKPAVIHMGMNHDRATCTVCIPKKP